MKRPLWPVFGVFALIFLLQIEVRLEAQAPVISEFLAANQTGLRDSDGDWSDWIEIYNPGQAEVSLADWHLSDDPDDLMRWKFPPVTIPGQGFLLVFASGKDRSAANAELHTNFKLTQDGEFLALTMPDGTVASAFTPTFPAQIQDLSYGLSMRQETVRLMATNSVGRMFVPVDNRFSHSWTQPTFDDSTWNSVSMAVGHELPLPDSGLPPAPIESLADLSEPGDVILATSANSPANEGVENVIDNNPNTKYLNRDKQNSGFTVRLGAGLSVIRALRLTSANDAPDRDPTSFLLSGSVDGRTFSEIARGTVPRFSGRFVAVVVSFANTTAYSHYQLLFPTVQNAGAAVAMQIAEVEFLGQAGAPPPTLRELIATDVESSVFRHASSLYLRLPFFVPQKQAYENIALRVRYADGFVAWLNGIPVARANAPATVAFDSVAITNRPVTSAVLEQRFDLSPYADLIHEGGNLLAIQALNDTISGPEFFFQAQLGDSRVELGEPRHLDSPTPGTLNTVPILGWVEEPVSDHERGFYEIAFDAALSSATPGATIRYTRDGTAPSPANGTVYTSPIRISRTTVLRAAAFRDGWRSSRVSTHTYLFLNDIISQNLNQALGAGFPTDWNGQAADYGLDSRVVNPSGGDNFGGKYTRSFKEDLKSLPTLSIVMATEDLFGRTGIYSNPNNRGAAWERPASVELIRPGRQDGFQVNAGVRIQGGAFRRFDLTLKKSFRLAFRDEYGAAKLRYPLFGADATDKFDNIVLRANSNDAWPYASGSVLYVRDAFAMETVRSMGGVSSHTTFMHLYLNGQYWGLYNPVERPDAAFSATYYGGNNNSWDAINQDSVPDGNYDAWNRLLAQLNQDFSQSAPYQRLQGNNPDGTRNPEYEDLLDVGNMIDYLILNFYVGNADWPGRNWWAGRDRDNGDGFKFYPWDTETALGLTDVNYDCTGVNSAVARPYAAVRANPAFRRDFGDRVFKHFSKGGTLYVNPDKPAWDPTHPENNQPAARLAALANQIDRAMVGESARWGDQLRTTPFTRDEHWEKARDNLLANYFPRRSAIVLDQFRRAGLYPRIDPPAMNHPGGTVEPGFQLTLLSSKGDIFYTLDGTDPGSPVNVEELSRTSLISRDAAKRVFIPSSSNGGQSLGSAWQGGREPFDDSNWTAGNGGVGYDQQASYLPLIQTDVRSAMEAKNTSAFVRIPFQLDTAALTRLNTLVLRMQYDDGFIAYLNGVQIASANAPGSPAWNSTATAANSDASAVVFRDIRIDAALNTLKSGGNLLAIHGLNVSGTSSDFLVAAELVASERRITSAATDAIAYKGPIAINDLVTIKTRVFDGEEWSALNQATFSPGTPSLTVSELHYHPADPTDTEIAAGFVDANDFEFIELFNNGSVTYDLAGAAFVAGIDFDFSQSSSITRLAPGQHLLIVRNLAAFELRYGPGLPVAGEYSGRLDNAGERIELVGSNQQVVLSFSYSPMAPWPSQADGKGSSLELVAPPAPITEPGSWQASTLPGGSPGQAAGNPLLVIGEIGVASGQLRFTFNGIAGLGYTVHSKDALSSGTWEVLEQAAPLAASQQIEVRVPLGTSPVTRFYRVSIP
jgi:hypothetical protein